MCHRFVYVNKISNLLFGHHVRMISLHSHRPFTLNHLTPKNHSECVDMFGIWTFFFQFEQNMNIEHNKSHHRLNCLIDRRFYHLLILSIRLCRAYNAFNSQIEIFQNFHLKCANLDNFKKMYIHVQWSSRPDDWFDRMEWDVLSVRCWIDKAFGMSVREIFFRILSRFGWVFRLHYILELLWIIR